MSWICLKHVYFFPSSEVRLHTREGVCATKTQFKEEMSAGGVEQHEEKSITIQSNIPEFTITLSILCHHSYSPLTILLKVTLGVVVRMLQWFPNLLMGKPVGPPVVAPTRRGGAKDGGGWVRGQLEPVVMGKQRLNNPTSNLLHINQQEGTTKSRILQHVALERLRINTLTSFFWCQYGLEKLHLSVRLLTVWIHSLSTEGACICLLAYSLVCVCLPARKNDRNECLWVIRPVGEEEGIEEERSQEEESDRKRRESSLIQSVQGRIDPAVWSETDLITHKNQPDNHRGTDKRFKLTNLNSKPGCEIFADFIGI